MPGVRFIHSRRQRRRITSSFDLQLTSMMDVMVIIVVFLLKSYASSTQAFNTPPGIKLPISVSRDTPPDSLSVTVTPEAITFENERVLEFMQTAANLGSSESGYAFKNADLDEQGRRIVPLYDALMRARNKSEMLRAKSQVRDAEGKPMPFEGVIAIQADKRMSYDTIRKIMYTSAAAGYRVFRFLALARQS